MSEPRPRWLSTSEAAELLGVKPRAVQKRAARGSLAARKVGETWEIDADAMDAATGPEVDAVDAATPNDGRREDDDRAQIAPKVDASTPDNGRVHRDAEDADRLADLRDEVKFLRGVIEQLQRDGAETRAALRTALKLSEQTAPPQLTAGAEPIQTKEETGAAVVTKVEAARVSPPPPRGKLAKLIRRTIGLR